MFKVSYKMIDIHNKVSNTFFNLENKNINQLIFNSAIVHNKNIYIIVQNEGTKALCTPYIIHYVIYLNICGEHIILL